jgi:putative endonuclease
MKFYYVYVLKSYKDNLLYIGYTTDLRKRVTDHNNGLNRSTKSRRPFKLIYYEAFLNKEEALSKERFYKSGRGHEILYNALFNTLRKI